MSSHSSPSSLTLLLAQYAALVPTRLTHFPASLDLARSQDALIADLLENPRLASYPPARQHRHAFWKDVVQRVEEGVREHNGNVESEEDELEVDERIYDILVSSMNASADTAPSGPPPPSYKTYFYPSPSPSTDYLSAITLHEDQTTISAGTTGLRTWQSSLRVAAHLLRTPKLLEAAGGRSVRVLELGAGVGFLGILVAKLLHAKGEGEGEEPKVVMTDVDEGVLKRCRGNVDINDLSDRVDVRELDWEEVHLSPSSSASADFIRAFLPTLVLAADVIYDPTLLPTLLTVLHIALGSNPSASVLLAATIRNPTTFDLFLSLAEQRGFQVRRETLSQLPVSERVFFGGEEGTGIEDVQLLWLTLLPSESRDSSPLI